MADYAIHDTTLYGISDVIRKKDGTQALIDPADYPDRINLMGMLEEKTASGAIASFSDGADDVPLKSLVFGITPSGGGGTPQNPVPIVGHTSLTGVHCGKNLFDNTATSQTLNGTTFTVNADKSITISGTPSVQTRIYLSRATYTIKSASMWSFGTMKSNTRVFCKKVSGGTTTYPTLSPNASCASGDTFTDILLEIDTTYDGTEFTIYPMLEVGNQATTYAPYSAETKTWEFPPFGKNQITSANAETKSNNSVSVTCDWNGIYTATGTATGGSANITFTLAKPYTIKSGDYFHALNSGANASVSITLQKQDNTSIMYFSLSPANRIVDLSS